MDTAPPPVPVGQRRPSLLSEGITERERNFWRNCKFEWEVSLDGKKRTLSVHAEDGIVKLAKRSKGEEVLVEIGPHTGVTVNVAEKQSLSLGWQPCMGKEFYQVEFKTFLDRCEFEQALRVCQDFHKSKIEFFENLALFTGTWNVGDTQPDDDLSAWLKPHGEYYDVYIIAVQECQYAVTEKHGMWAKIKKGKHFLKSLSQLDMSDPVEADFFTLVGSHLPDHYMVASHSLMTMRLAVFARDELERSISNVKISTEATGIANVVGNKGGIGIQFNVYDTSVCAIGSHLAAHQSEVERRNSDYFSILEGLKLGNTEECEVLTEFDHLFWLGDLNYRIDLPRDNVMHLITSNDIPALYAADQLRRERERAKVFAGWHEGEITFMPTYRFLRGTEQYDEALGRIPSWCDRILWYDAPSRAEHTQLLEYTSVPSVCSSDHKPVYGIFSLRAMLPPPLLPKPDSLIGPPSPTDVSDAVEGDTGGGADTASAGGGGGKAGSGSKGATKSKKGEKKGEAKGRRRERKLREKERSREMSACPVLRLKGLRGVNLLAMDMNGSSDPYVRIRTPVQAQARAFKTPMVANSLNPQWKDSDIAPITLRVPNVRYLAAHSLHFSVWDYDFGSGDDHMGSALVSLAPALAQPGHVVKFSVALVHKGKPAGALCGGLVVDHDDADEAYSLRVRSQSAVLTSRRKFTFAAMLESDWSMLFALGEQQVLKPGEVLLTRGCANDMLYRVVSGHLEVAVGDRIRATIHAGGVTGEMSFLGRTTTSATLVAAEPTVVRAVKTSVAEAALRENEALRMRFYYYLAATIGKRLKGMNASTLKETARPRSTHLLPDGSPESLDAVLADKEVYALFREYLRGRWALETAECMDLCGEYRAEEDVAKRVVLANTIFDTYVDEGAPKEVCLASAAGIDAIRQALDAGEVDLFEEVEVAVRTMWQSDACPKFLRSKPFLAYDNSASDVLKTGPVATPNAIADYSAKHHHRWGTLRVFADVLDFRVHVLGFEKRYQIPLGGVKDVERDGSTVRIRMQAKKKVHEFRFKTPIKTGDCYRTVRSLLQALDEYRARRVALPDALDDSRRDEEPTRLTDVHAVVSMDRRPQQEGELSLCKGDHIVCEASKMLHGYLWYYGTSENSDDNVSGWFPSHYVDLMGAEQSTSGLPSNEDWLLLLKRAEKRTYAAGEYILEVNSPVHEFYSVLSGTCDVFTDGKRVGSIVEGEVIGGLTLILGGEASATVIASSTEVHVVSVAAIYLSDLLKENHSLACKFFKYLALVNELRLRRLLDNSLRASEDVSPLAPVDPKVEACDSVPAGAEGSG